MSHNYLVGRVPIPIYKMYGVHGKEVEEWYAIFPA
jgi:hypothetical protein